MHHGSVHSGTMYDKSYYGGGMNIFARGMSAHPAGSMHGNSQHGGAKGVTSSYSQHGPRGSSSIHGGGSLLGPSRMQAPPAGSGTTGAGGTESGGGKPSASFQQQQLQAPDYHSLYCPLMQKGKHGSSGALAALAAAGYVAPLLTASSSGRGQAKPVDDNPAAAAAVQGGGLYEGRGSSDAIQRNMRLALGVLSESGAGEEAGTSGEALQAGRASGEEVLQARMPQSQSHTSVSPAASAPPSPAPGQSQRGGADSLPGLVPGESLHRKMLALMALDQAARVEQGAMMVEAAASVSGGGVKAMASIQEGSPMHPSCTAVTAATASTKADASVTIAPRQAAVAAVAAAAANVTGSMFADATRQVRGPSLAWHCHPHFTPTLTLTSSHPKSPMCIDKDRPAATLTTLASLTHPSRSGGEHHVYGRPTQSCDLTSPHSSHLTPTSPHPSHLPLARLTILAGGQPHVYGPRAVQRKRVQREGGESGANLAM